MTDYKKIWEFVVDSYIIDWYKDKFLEVGNYIIDNPKPVVSFVNLGFYLEYLYKFVEGKISMEDFVYLGDVVGKKVKLIDTKKIVLEAIFYVWKDIKLGKKKKYSEKYLVFNMDAKKYFSSKMDIKKFENQIEKLKSQVIYI